MKDRVRVGRSSEAARQRGSEAARQRGSEAAKQRGSEAARQRNSETAKQRSSEAANSERTANNEQTPLQLSAATTLYSKRNSERNGGEAARQRGSEAAKQRSSEAARQRGSETAAPPTRVGCRPWRQSFGRHRDQTALRLLAAPKRNRLRAGGAVQSVKPTRNCQ